MIFAEILARRITLIVIEEEAKERVKSSRVIFVISLYLYIYTIYIHIYSILIHILIKYQKNDIPIKVNS